MAVASKVQSDKWINILIMSTMVGSVGILAVALLAWQRPFAGQIALQVGRPAPYDIVAPSDIEYESELRTAQARERAAQAVPEVFDNIEGRIRRQQVSRIREILEFISIVRNDPHSTPELQIDYLLAIPDLHLTPEVALWIQDLPAEDWELVVREAPLTLDRAMREEVRESNLPLVRRRVPSLISAELNEQASNVAAEIVRALIQTNSILNQARTEELREQARMAVPVQTALLARGQTIIRAGDIAGLEDVEALTQLGLLQRDWDSWTLVRAVMFSLIVMAIMIAALYRLRPRTLRDYQELAVLVVIAVLWLLAAKFLIVPHDWLPYLYPLAALSMVLTAARPAGGGGADHWVYADGQLSGRQQSFAGDVYVRRFAGRRAGAGPA
jgi:membrane-associated HD superfamily phosphohydrolase